MPWGAAHREDPLRRSAAGAGDGVDRRRAVLFWLTEHPKVCCGFDALRSSIDAVLPNLRESGTKERSLLK